MLKVTTETTVTVTMNAQEATMLRAFLHKAYDNTDSSEFSGDSQLELIADLMVKLVP